jgi:hypothetical protein
MTGYVTNEAIDGGGGIYVRSRSFVHNHPSGDPVKTLPAK